MESSSEPLTTDPGPLDLSTFLNGLTQPKKNVETLEILGQGEMNLCESPRTAQGDTNDRHIEAQLYNGTLFSQEEGQWNDLHRLIIKLFPENVETPRIDLRMFRIMMKNLKLSRSYMMSRVFHQVLDQNQDGQISPNEFIAGLSTLIRGNLEDQIKFAFNVYSREGFITLENATSCLNESFEPREPFTSSYHLLRNANGEFSEMINGLVNLVFAKLDVDRDGKISFNDFRSACVKDPTLVEALGPCLPKDCICHNAHRVSPQGESSNSSNSVDYLTKTSLMARICTPVNTLPNRKTLTPIDLKQK